MRLATTIRQRGRHSVRIVHQRMPQLCILRRDYIKILSRGYSIKAAATPALLRRFGGQASISLATLIADCCSVQLLTLIGCHSPVAVYAASMHIRSSAIVVLLQSQMWVIVLRLDLAPSAGLMDQENKQRANKRWTVKCILRGIQWSYRIQEHLLVCLAVI